MVSNQNALSSWPTARPSGVVLGSLGKLPLFMRHVYRLLTVPTLQLDLGPSAEMHGLRRYLRPRLLGLRIPVYRSVTVLVIPEASGAYMQGPSKQTLRRMCRKAEDLGVQCRHVTDADERRALLEQGIAQEQNHPNPLYRRANPDISDILDVDLWIAAYDRNGRPLALSVTPIGRNCAVLRYFRTLEASNDATLARYSLTAVLAEELCQRGVRYLVNTLPPHKLNASLRHFANMVGFTVARATFAR